MTDLKRTGYLASAQTAVWTSGQSLDSLTDNEYTDLSDEIDNSTNLYMFADFELVLGSAAFTGADCGFELYLVPSIDGTNYPTWTGNGTADEPENGPFSVGFMPLTGTTAAQRAALRDVDLPSGKWKLACRNRGNVTLAGSGNTLKWRPHSVSSV